MITLNQCCCGFSLKTGAYVAAVLFMIRSLLGIVSSGILIGYALDTLDIINNSIRIFTWTAFLIFSINVIVAIRKENLKTILAFLLVLGYFLVLHCTYMFYKVVYFFAGYNYDIFDNFVLKPATIIAFAYCSAVVFSFYRQLTNAQEMPRTKEIHLQNEKKPIPA